MCTWTATEINGMYFAKRGRDGAGDAGTVADLRDKRDQLAAEYARLAAVEGEDAPRFEAVLLAADALAETVVRGAVASDDANGGANGAGYVGNGIDRTHHHTALLWTGASSGEPVSLHPKRILGGESESYVSDAGERLAAGYGRGEATRQRDVALHPAGLLGEEGASRAHGVTDRYVIGSCSGEATAGRENAVVWSRGPRLKAANIHPAGLLGAGASSRLHAADGAFLVGDGNGANTGQRDHALAWTDAAPGCALSLHPRRLLGEASFSYALAVRDGATGARAAGHGRGENTRLYSHALLWNRLAPGAATDLHPAALLGAGSCSYATALTESGAVGFGRGSETDYLDHALLWPTGDATNAVDLHQFTPPGSLSSRAYGVDADGNVLGWIDGQAALWKRVR
jgi:hypothetical protein